MRHIELEDMHLRQDITTSTRPPTVSHKSVRADACSRISTTAVCPAAAANIKAVVPVCTKDHGPCHVLSFFCICERRGAHKLLDTPYVHECSNGSVSEYFQHKAGLVKGSLLWLSCHAEIMLCIGPRPGEKMKRKDKITIRVCRLLGGSGHGTSNAAAGWHGLVMYPRLT